MCFFCFPWFYAALFVLWFFFRFSLLLLFRWTAKRHGKEGTQNVWRWARCALYYMNNIFTLVSVVVGVFPSSSGYLERTNLVDRKSHRLCDVKKTKRRFCWFCFCNVCARACLCIFTSPKNTTPPSSLMFISGHTKVIPSFPWLMIGELETPHTQRFLRTEIKQNTHDVQRYDSNCNAIFEWNYVMQKWVHFMQQVDGKFKPNESFGFASLGFKSLQIQLNLIRTLSISIIRALVLDLFICAIIQYKNKRHKNKFPFFFSVWKTLKMWLNSFCLLILWSPL